MIFRRSMSPYVAKKYGHLLEEEEDTESILKERVGNRITNQNIYILHFQDTTISTILINPKTFFYKRRQFLRVAKNEQILCNSIQMLNYKVSSIHSITVQSNYFQTNSWWPSTRKMSEVEKIIVSHSCSSRNFIKNKN